MTPDPRYILPAALGCGVVFFGGLAAGNIIGAPASSGTSTQVYTYTQHVKGRVITVRGVKKVVLPARTVTRDGLPVTLPAATVDFTRSLPPRTTQLPGRTVLRTVNGTVVTTVVSTATVPTTITNTGTVTQTVTGPTTTDTETETVPVTITDTVTETGPTTTVTETVTGGTT